MITFIQQTNLKLISFLGFLSILSACDAASTDKLQNLKVIKLQTPQGKIIKTYVAKTEQQQRGGLSGIKKNDFPKNYGMLFPSNRMKLRQFWMPNTYFDIDIFFMNADYYIIDVHRSLAKSPGLRAKEDVPLSKKVFSQHVLEMRSDSEIAKKLHPGMKLIKN